MVPPVVEASEVATIDLSSSGGVSVTRAVLLPGFGSGWPVVAIVATFVCGVLLVICAVMTSVTLAPEARLGTDQTRVPLLKLVPAEGVAVWKLTPAGIASETCVPVAVLGP